MKVDQNKYKCRIPGCYYEGYAPMLRVHMKMAHDITIVDEEENK